MQTQRRFWKMFQRYNVVNMVVSTCIIAALGLNMFGKVQPSNVVEAQAASVCSYTGTFTNDAITSHHDEEWATRFTRYRQKMSDISSSMKSSGYQQCFAAEQLKNVQSDDQDSYILDGRAHPLQTTSSFVPTTKDTQSTSKSAKASDTTHHLPATGSSNAFPFGQCTWWADQRYYQLHGIFVPWRTNAFAANWINQAHTFGWHVSGTPKVGSILVLQPGVQGAFSAGHVGVVEHLLGNGSVIASSMNWGSNPRSVTDDTFHSGPGVAFLGWQD